MLDDKKGDTADTVRMPAPRSTKRKPAKDSDEEPEGHDPYNKAPKAENTESKD